MNIEKITEYYVLHGLTFQEIAWKYGVTRQAVHAFYKRNKLQADEIALTFDCTSGFIQQMKFRRKQLGITQQSLAEKVGTYKSNISLIESGRYKNSKYISKISEVLDINC